MSILRRIIAIGVLVRTVLPLLLNKTNNNNYAIKLFADLAPLLALIGETRWLRGSVGWIDRVAFAMAPAGVLAAIGGAIEAGIKVPGGRSGGKCDNTGSAPPVSTTDVGEPQEDGEGMRQVLYTPEDGENKSPIDIVPGSDPAHQDHQSIATPRPPPLPAKRNRVVLYLITFLGLVLQSAVLLFQFITIQGPDSLLKQARLVARHASQEHLFDSLIVSCSTWQFWEKIDSLIASHSNWQLWEIIKTPEVPEYALPATVFGTVLVAFGTFICACVLSSTKKTGRPVIATIGIMATEVGFLVQYIGLRAMPWTAVLPQVLVTGIMGVLRGLNPV